MLFGTAFGEWEKKQSRKLNNRKITLSSSFKGEKGAVFYDDEAVEAINSGGAKILNGDTERMVKPWKCMRGISGEEGKTSFPMHKTSLGIGDMSGRQAEEKEKGLQREEKIEFICNGRTLWGL